MGLRERIKLAPSAAAESANNGLRKAGDELDRRGIDVGELSRSVQASSRTYAAKAQDNAIHARDQLEQSGVDVNAFYSAAVEGIGVTNRHGEMRRWRVAKAALRPTRTTRGAATGLVREALRQRRELASAGRALAAPGRTEFAQLELDQSFYAELIDWIIAESGVDDTDEQRAQVLVFLADVGIDAVAESVLPPKPHAAYAGSMDEESVDLAHRTSVLLKLAPDSKFELLGRLERARTSAIETGLRQGSIRPVAGD
jgi:hypothetical protein